MKFYVGSADDLPLSERVMPGLVAVAWAEAQVLARKWQQKKDSKQPDVSPSCDATTARMPLPEAKQHWLGSSSALIDFDSSTDWIRCSNNCRSWMPCCFPKRWFLQAAIAACFLVATWSGRHAKLRV